MLLAKRRYWLRGQRCPPVSMVVEIELSVVGMAHVRTQLRDGNEEGDVQLKTVEQGPECNRGALGVRLQRVARWVRKRQKARWVRLQVAPRI
jgi:hypothetical protein